MGDFNAVVGEGKKDEYVGHYGLGNHNDRAQMLVHGVSILLYCTSYVTLVTVLNKSVKLMKFCKNVDTSSIIKIYHFTCNRTNIKTCKWHLTKNQLGRRDK